MKFFTPSEMIGDSQAATNYLWQKYNDHHCAALPERDARDDLLSILEPPIHRKKVG
jgi:hypothetical protein